MFGIVIQYELSGDEEAWKEAVRAFLADIEADPALNGHFRYEVNIAAKGPGRVHVGHWDSEDTLAHLRAQPFFKAFAEKLGGFAGDTLRSTPFSSFAATPSAD